MSRHDTALKYFNENRGYMDERVKYGVENYRKGNARLSFVDKDGREIKNVSVRAEQLDHDFKFGANCFMLDQLETTEKNAQYKDAFAGVFNLATIPFYWDTLEPVKGHPRFAKDSEFIYRRPPIDTCVEFCEENGITPKAHCLNYDRFAPAWLHDDKAEIQRYLVKRFSELSERYGGRVPGWEVTNELLCSNGVTDFYWDPDNMEWSFNTARRFFIANELIVNEAASIWDGVRHTRSPYYMMLERAFSKGAPIDAIGFQYHSFFHSSSEADQAQYRYDPVNLYGVLDTYTAFNRPFQITEITLPQYFDTDADRDIQAELLRDSYSVFFSHPNMEAVIYWNLADGYAWSAKPGDMNAGENYFRGGLINFDMSKKPAYNELRRLIKEEWHTSAIAKTGESDSHSAFRGFYGNYDLEISHDGNICHKQVHLTKHSRNEFKIVLGE